MRVSYQTLYALVKGESPASRARLTAVDNITLVGYQCKTEDERILAMMVLLGSAFGAVIGVWVGFMAAKTTGAIIGGILGCILGGNLAMGGRS